MRICLETRISKRPVGPSSSSGAAGGTVGPLLRSEKIPRFKWVNTLLGNIKNAITDTHRAQRSLDDPEKT
jgi:hypothetical protein